MAYGFLCIYSLVLLAKYSRGYFMECSIRLTIFDAAKRVISASQQEFQRLLILRREQIAKSQL